MNILQKPNLQSVENIFFKNFPILLSRVAGDHEN